MSQPVSVTFQSVSSSSPYPFVYEGSTDAMSRRAKQSHWCWIHPPTSSTWLSSNS